MSKSANKKYSEVVNLELIANTKKEMIGIKIKIGRVSKGLSQAELAAILKREKTQVSRAERLGSKDIEFIQEVELALGLPKGWIA